MVWAGDPRYVHVSSALRFLPVQATRRVLIGDALIHALSTFLLSTSSLILFTLNTLFWSVPPLTLSAFRLLVPAVAVCRRVNPMLNWVTTRWIGCNDAWIGVLQYEP